MEKRRCLSVLIDFSKVTAGNACKVTFASRHFSIFGTDLCAMNEDIVVQMAYEAEHRIDGRCVDSSNTVRCVNFSCIHIEIPPWYVISI